MIRDWVTFWTTLYIVLDLSGIAETGNSDIYITVTLVAHIHGTDLKAG